MNVQCRCPYPHAGHPGSSLPGVQPIGYWAPMPNTGPDTGPDTVHSANTNCACRPQPLNSELNAVSDAVSGALGPDMPTPLPEIEWEASDDISDDAEFVAIRATDLADMLSDLRDCRCNASCKAPE